MMRQRVLRAFKIVHRARQGAFESDEKALAAGREKINMEFRKHIAETDEKTLEKLVRIAEDSAVMLEKCVVQGVQKDDGKFELRIRDSTLREENHPYEDVKITKDTKS